MSEYYIEVVWNREFHWCRDSRPFTNLVDTETAAKRMLNDGYGDRIKKARIVNQDNEVIIARVSY